VGVVGEDWLLKKWLSAKAWQIIVGGDFHRNIFGAH
jgi:hypothetical protein